MMKEIIDTLHELTGLLNWQVTLLIILFVVRKHIGLIFNGLYGLLNRTTKIVVDGKTVTLEAAAEIIQEQNQVIVFEQKQKKELTKELHDYTAGGIQVIPKKILSDNIERIGPYLKNLGAETLRGKPNAITPSDDPQKGLWGRLHINNDKIISATVWPIEHNKNLFKVTLVVTSTNSDRPLKGNVTFHLHPTFINPQRVVPAENGEAQLHLIAYGAFTVGARTDDGTELELDLAENKSFPEEFRNN